MTWIRVTYKDRCPVCGRDNWCSVTPDGLVMCMRADEVDLNDWNKVKYVESNGGTIFQPASARTLKLKPREKKERKPSNIRWDEIVPGFEINDLSARPKASEWLAEQLGIPSIFLEMFGMGWAERHKAFTFPMYDHERNITGVRLRYINGKKAAITGSRDGVFMQMFDIEQPLMITEGPTDAAALASLGFAAIGRPNCMGAVEIIAKLSYKQNVVIVSDSDGPGRRGADALATRIIPLANAIKIIEPTGTATDARDWVNKGATHEVIQMVIDNAADHRTRSRKR